jgi:hypothetical protein
LRNSFGDAVTKHSGLTDEVAGQRPNGG